MAEYPLSKSAPIVIIGAGVFGLSTALHLGQRGYTNVTVLDKQPYDQTLYSYDKGCDGASAGMAPKDDRKRKAHRLYADINKILRCAYGPDTIYSNLALEAREVFLQWNAELAAGMKSPPPGMTERDTLYVNCGTLCVLDEEGPLPAFEQQSLDHMTSIGKADTQYVVSKAEDINRAKEDGYGHCVDPFNRKERGLPYNGLLDTVGGFVYADKSCRFVLHKARSLGIHFVFGKEGTFHSFTSASLDSGEVTGVKTAVGVEHPANLVIVAGGGWTPTIVPEMDCLCETTGGSVCFYKIPKSSPLWDRFAPSKFPSYGMSMRAGAEGGIYGFPRDEDGILKIGYRGTK